MFPSMEVRWFYQGTVPAEVAKWFQSGTGRAEAQAPRVDYYLDLQEMDGLGIKLREGKVEVKRRQRQHGLRRFREQAAGVVEHWRKWSFELSMGEGELSDSLRPVSSWVAVQKERQLRKYRVAEDERLVPVPAEAYPERGCSVELSSLCVEGQDWWSLCFEAFGDESSLRQTLLLVVEEVLTCEGVPFPLDAEASYGYPRWLASLRRPPQSVDSHPKVG
jgi:hypothetical protein